MTSISIFSTILIYSFFAFNCTSFIPTCVKYFADDVVPFPICPYVLSPDTHTVPSFLITPVFLSSSYISPILINIASVTSVPSSFSIVCNFDVFVVVPLLNCPYPLYPVAYTFPSLPNIVVTLEFNSPYFAFISVPSSNVNFVNLVLSDVSPTPNSPYLFLPAVHTVPSSLIINVESFPAHILFISFSTMHVPVGVSAVVPFPRCPYLLYPLTQEFEFACINAIKQSPALTDIASVQSLIFVGYTFDVVVSSI